MMEISPQYLAGFVDADGCITLNNWGKGNRRCLKLMLLISNTRKEIIDLVKEQYGGTISKHEFPPNKNYKTAYTLFWCSAKAITVIEKIEPFLVLKKQQAELALAFWKIFDRPRKEKFHWPNGKGMHMLPAYEQQMENFKTQIRGLNHRGKE